MLKMVIKYEFKSTWRYLLSFCLVMFAVTCITKVMLCIGAVVENFAVVSVLFRIVFNVVLIVFLIISFLQQIMGYYRSIATDEAYQTFSLPVSLRCLLGGKLVTYVINNYICMGIIWISEFVVMFHGYSIKDNISNITRTMNDLFAEFGEHHLIILLVLFIMVGVTFLTYNLFMFAAVAIGQAFQGNKVSASLISGIGLYIGMMILMIPMVLLSGRMCSNGKILSFCALCMLLLLIADAIFYQIVKYMLTNRLNVE